MLDSKWYRVTRRTWIMLIAVAIPLAMALSDARGDWPHWRGPLANGFSPDADPPTEWSETKNVQWKVALPGQGTSTPIVWEDQVFVLTAIPTDKRSGEVPPADQQPQRPFGIKFADTIYRFVVISLDRRTGEKLWERTAAEVVPFQGHHPDNSFASASPVTDGKYLYVPFGSQGYYCFDLAGNLRWKRDLGPVVTRLSFGEAASPVIYEDSLIITRDNEEQSRILVLDATTGETRWQAERDEPSAWATPLVVEHEGRVQVVTNASNRVRSYDLKTGDLIWECSGQVSNVTPSPVVLGDVVLCMSGYRGAALQAISLSASGNVDNTESLLWQRGRSTPYVPSPLLFGQRLYFNKSNDNILTCLDAKTGEPIFEEIRVDALRGIYASPVGAAGRVYFLDRDGTTLVISAEANSPDPLAVNRLDDYFDASPAIVGKQMFLRGKQFLYALQEE
jgi:outer membrane protein assembly factor BamB